jgi:hypothetical protein
MTQEHNEDSHPAPHRGRVETHEALFSVCAAPLAWLVQLSAIYAFSSTPCFHFGDRLLTHAGVQPWPLIIGAACLLVALASLWLGFVLLRRTRGETGGGRRHLFETGEGRTRFLAVWGVAFASVFTVLIVVNLLLLIGMPVCES